MSIILLPSLGKNIKILRISVELKQQELADRIGISRTYMNFIENDRKEPRISTLRKIAQQLGCSIRDLFPED
jgi:DNA-binding XRE family transcriptional regulator